MITLFFIGIGISSIATGFAREPIEIGIGLTFIGVFAAIYHPVGLAMVVQGRSKTGMPIAINGVFGNMGVASAALITGAFIDTLGWQAGFVLPGAISIFIGLGYFTFTRSTRIDAVNSPQSKRNGSAQSDATPIETKKWIRIFAIVCFTTALGGLIFQSTTFALPKILDDRLAELAGTATAVGWYAFLVFSVAAFAQLVVGYLIDRHSIRKVFIVIALLQAIFLGLMTQLDQWWSVMGAIAFMLAVFGQIPINDVLIGRISRNEWRSRAYAARYIITFSVMATTIPLIAWIYGNWGANTLFALLAITALVIFAAVLLLPEKALKGVG